MKIKSSVLTILIALGVFMYAGLAYHTLAETAMAANSGQSGPVYDVGNPSSDDYQMQELRKVYPEGVDEPPDTSPKKILIYFKGNADNTSEPILKKVNSSYKVWIYKQDSLIDDAAEKLTSLYLTPDSEIYIVGFSAGQDRAFSLFINVYDKISTKCNLYFISLDGFHLYVRTVQPVDNLSDYKNVVRYYCWTTDDGGLLGKEQGVTQIRIMNPDGTAANHGGEATEVVLRTLGIITDNDQNSMTENSNGTGSTEDTLANDTAGTDDKSKTDIQTDSTSGTAAASKTDNSPQAGLKTNTAANSKTLILS